MNLNPTKQRLEAGEATIGGVCFSGSPLVAEWMALAGCDFVLVDNQHGIWDKERCTTAFRGVRLGRATPMTRVEQNDFYAIGSVLDQGALGVVVPMVNTKQDAQAAVLATYYPPLGQRSHGAMGAAFYGVGDPRAMNGEIFLAVQIETEQAVSNAEEILSVPGIDGCWIGPVDLASSLGVDLNTADGRQRHEDSIAHVLQVCQETGKIPGIAAWPNDAQQRIDAGFRFVTAIYDLMALQERTKEVLEGLRPTA